MDSRRLSCPSELTAGEILPATILVSRTCLKFGKIFSVDNSKESNSP